jgi:CheY-like chemotaxis protein
MLRHEGKCHVLNVLVVDDDPEIRRVLREILEPLEYDVREASNGREALPMVARHEPDLLIVDILMPDMDGLETIRFLRGQGHRMPIIAMPAGKYLTAERYSEFARSFGADEVLLKPFGRDEVLAILERVLGRDGTEGRSKASASK